MAQALPGLLPPAPADRFTRQERDLLLRDGISTFTVDQGGNVLPNATVRAFRTSSNELVSQVLSDANGYYIATTPYGDGHFLTVHAATVPPVAGASIDTLTPG